jgi:hypothetical protein
MAPQHRSRVADRKLPRGKSPWVPGASGQSLLWNQPQGGDENPITGNLHVQFCSNRIPLQLEKIAPLRARTPSLVSDTNVQRQ